MLQQNVDLKSKPILITGAAGFIGANLSERLLRDIPDAQVIGLDSVNDYYDVRLKEYRLSELTTYPNFTFIKGNLADKALIDRTFEQYQPQIVVNLAAQAGVRYSITNPDTYIEANLIGFYNILEACRHHPVEHLVYASSSSVYGSNKKVPYSTEDKVDNPVSLYAATKKSNELMAHAYAKLYNIPCTGAALFHGLWPGRTARHGILWLHQQAAPGRDHPDLQLWQLQARLHLHRRHRRRYRSRDAARARKGDWRGWPAHPALCALQHRPTTGRRTCWTSCRFFRKNWCARGVLPEDYDFEAHKQLVPMQPGGRAGDLCGHQRAGAGLRLQARHAAAGRGCAGFAQWYKAFYMTSNS